MNKTILIIGGGLLQHPAILAAKKMGYHVIVTDYNPDVIGMKDADTPIIMSTRDIDGSVRVAKQQHEITPISGVLTVGTDASMTVAAVANALGLPGLKFEDAEAATNKLKMRTRFKEHDVPSPNFSPVWSLKDAKSAAKELGFPLVLKPSDNMGARGVSRIDNHDEIAQAFQFAKDASRSGELIIEEYMEGSELSIDAIIYNNEITITGVADRIIDMHPYFIETGHTMPSHKPHDLLEKACTVMKKGIRALGINIGAAKGDIKLTPQGPMVGEIAARLSGGFMSAHTYPLSTGVNLMKAAIEVSMDTEPSNLEPLFDKVSIERAIILDPGFVKKINGLEAAYRVPGIKEIFINIQPGDRITPPRSNVEKAGHIIAVGNTLEEAEKAIEECRKVLEFEILPENEISMSAIRLAAREKLKKMCNVCPKCDGADCPTGVPGIGGTGTGASFRRNITALEQYKVTTRLIHNVTNPDTSTTFLGHKLELPVLIAPITGAVTNLGGAIDELEYNRAIVKGSIQAGTLSFVGDGATPTKYKIGLQAVSESNGLGIPIFKPRSDNKEIIKRVHAAEEAGAIAVGMDIDAVVFKTMAMKNQSVSPKSISDLKEIIGSTTLPFILKGIMNSEDAKAAIDVGVGAIFVSNHGGRVLDEMAGSMDVLPGIIKTVNSQVPVLVDGGFRTGIDVLKALAIGADIVCIGRPAAIAAVGMGTDGTHFYLKELQKELTKAMILTGCNRISSVPQSLIIKL